MTDAIGSARRPERPRYGLLFLGLVVGILVVVAVYTYIWQCFFVLPTEAGPAGDMFGGLTALFTGLAFAGLIVTMIMQHDELRLQREELSATRQEMRGQREQLELQNRFIAKQNFESTFFKMVSQLNSIIELTTFSGRNGRSAIQKAAAHVDAAILKAENEGVQNAKFIIMKFEQIYEGELEEFLGGYLRILYTAIHFVRQSKVEEFGASPWLYVRILRGQLSAGELLFILFLGLSKYGRRGFKRQIELYDLLKHLPRKYTTQYPSLVDMYQLSKPGIVALRGVPAAR